MILQEYLGLQEWSTTQEKGYYRLEPIFFLIGFFICCLLIILLIRYNFKHKELSERWLLTKFILVLLAGLIICLIFIYDIIEIYISVNSDNSNFIWSILNVLIIGIFMNIIGIGSSMKQVNRTFLLLAVVYLAIVGFGYFGFLIKFNLPFLIYKKYETNTIRGIYFLTLNIVFLLLVFFISFLSESDVSQ